MIAPIVQNLFEEHTSEEYKEKRKEEDKRIAQISDQLSPIKALLAGAGSLINTGWAQSARAYVNNEALFWLGKENEAWLADWNSFVGMWDNTFADYHMKTRQGALIGETIGGTAGFIVGFFLPGGPAVWEGIFKWAGGYLGGMIQGGGAWGNYDHPDIPGSPGDVVGDDPYQGLPGYDIPHDIPAGMIPDPTITPFLTGGGAGSPISSRKLLALELTGHWL